MRRDGYHSAEVVQFHHTGITAFLTVFAVIADMKDDGLGGQSFFQQLQCELLRHFCDDDAGLLERVGAGKYLSGTKALAGRAILLDILHRTGFHAESMINQDLRINSENLVERLLIENAHQSKLSHGIYTNPCESGLCAVADLPEVRQRQVIPQKLLISRFIQIGDSDAVTIGLGVLRHNVHCDLGKI